MSSTTSLSQDHRWNICFSISILIFGWKYNHSVSVSGTTGNPSPALTGDVRRISEGFRASGTASGVFTKVNDPNNPITGSSSNSPVAGFTFDGTHTHTFSASGTSGNEGSGSAIENRPPYYALMFIMKL